MRISLQIPSAESTKKFNAQQQPLPFTYQPHGCTRTDICPDGFDADVEKTFIGHGAADWIRAKDAIRAWQMFPQPWTSIQPTQAPVEVGTQVAMYAQFGFIWWRNACRIVYTIDEPTRFGFAYGTTPAHMESGEELFLVEIDAQEQIWYTIKAFSRPNTILAWIGYPLMRMLQAKFRRDSAVAMRL